MSLVLAVLAALSAARSSRRAWFLAGTLLLAFVWASCDVGTQKITTTLAGTYAFSLTASYTANGTLQHSIELGLTVN
jgi:hypothetical protein